MEQPYYEPESSVPSPYLKGIVNAKHKLQYFVHIFHSGISAITLNLDQKKKDALKVGDLLEVIVKYNQYAREGQNSRHIVLDYRRLETHSTVREITSDSIGAVVHLIARFQKRENYNLFYNELFGEIHDNFKHVPESAAHSGRPLLLEIVAKRLVKEKINGLVCTKFLSFADAKGLDTRVVKKSASGLLLAFNGFSYSAWSPDYLNELRLGSRLISISDTDFLGRWFSFDSVQESADGSLRVDGKVEIREDVFPTRVKENVVEVEMRCEASGEKNGCALLKTDAGLVIDTDQLLKRPENQNHTFPKSWWFIPMLREQYSLKLSPNNFKRSIEVKVEYLDLNVEKEKEYNGLIMDVMPDGRSYVWCSEFDKDLLMYTKLIPESKPLGKWIKFSQYRKENDRFWILNPKLIDSVCPTRFNEKTNSLEIYINCISQEDDDYLGNPVYFSEDFGYVSDFDRIIDIDGPLPFDTWVVLIRETKESRCRFSISKSNNLDTSRSPKQTSSSDAKIDGLLRRDSAPLVRRVTPPPGFIPKRTTQSSSTAATAVLPPLKPKFADLMHLMPRNDDDGMYSSDDEDEMGGVRAFSTEAPRPVQMVSSSTASSVGDSDHELEMELPSTAAVGQKTHSVPFNASQYAGKSLREISLLILEDPALSRLIEEKNRRLYHAFANRVYNG